MGEVKVIFTPHASANASNKRANGAFPPVLARPVSRSPASRTGQSFHTPKDVARELIAAGIPAHENSIRRRCCLPAGDERRIKTNPAFPGRHYVPDSELARLLNVEAAA